MYLHKLTLENFRSHKATVLKFGKVNLIRGLNNSGKSSIAQAIEYLLTGRCLGLDEAGRGAEQLIQTGWRQATITGEIGSPEAVDLQLTRTRSVSGGNVTAKCNGRSYAGRQIEELFEKKGWNRDVLSGALRGGRFLSLSPAEQKELLADVLRPEAIAIPVEILEAMRYIANEINPTWSGYVGAGRIDLDGARVIEKDSIQTRANATAALRELGEPEPIPERPKDAPTSQQVQGRLDELRKEQNAASREKERRENEWASKSKRHRELPEEIRLAQVHILADADEKRYLEAIENEAKTKFALSELGHIGARIEEVKGQIANAGKHEGKCPTCGHEADTDEIVERLRGSLKALESRVPGLQQTVDRYPNAADARDALRVHREAITAVERLKKELAGFGKIDPPEVKELAAQIEELEGRIQKGQQVLADTVTQEERYRSYGQARVRRGDLEAKREAADKLAKWAGPSGVQAQMSAGKLGPFTEAINLVLGRFGYEAKIELDPYRISARRMDSEANLQLDSLSESENWRFSMAFQTALAKTTGLNLIVLDRADVLVGANRGTMLQSILGCDLEQVFILASTAEKAKMPPEITVFDLELNEKGETVVTNG